MQIKHKALAIVINLIIVFQPVIPLLEYELFYDYITQELCVEKDIPDSCCNGKCHLEKRLDEAGATGNDNPTEGNTVKRIRDVEWNLPVQVVRTSCFFSTTVKFEFIPSQYYFDGLNEIFHPPCDNS